MEQANPANPLEGHRYNPPLKGLTCKQKVFENTVSFYVKEISNYNIFNKARKDTLWDILVWGSLTPSS